MRISGRCRASERSMNVIPEPCGAARARAPAQNLPFIADREFLPADLEILDTPPSPVRMALILVDLRPCRRRRCLGLGRPHRHRRRRAGQDPAHGTGKVIQPLEAGKVTAIRVQNGQRVKAGEVLIEMDSGDPKRRRPTPRPPTTPAAPRPYGARPRLTPHGRESSAPAPPSHGTGTTPARYRSPREIQVLAGDLGQLAATASPVSTRKSGRSRSSATVSTRPMDAQQS